jgi:hypothetical protein
MTKGLFDTALRETGTSAHNDVAVSAGACWRAPLKLTI